jgi:hypothetical protein
VAPVNALRLTVQPRLESELKAEAADGAMAAQVVSPRPEMAAMDAAHEVSRLASAGLDGALPGDDGEGEGEGDEGDEEEDDMHVAI